MMLKAGFSRVDITPPLGSPLAGYFKIRLADGVLDPIEINALAVNDGENTLLFLIGDTLYFVENAATPIRERVSEATGVPMEHIFLQGLHQHTSIRLGYRNVEHIASSMTDPNYLDIFYRRICDAAKMAMDDMKEATVGVAEKETEKPHSFIRRYRMKDGSVRTNPGWLNPDVVGPMSEADNTVRLVRFFRQEGGDIALVNFSTHPDVIGGTKISADWPGFVRRLTEKALPGVHCLLMNGPQGDTNHINYMEPKWTCSNYEFCRNMGQGITDTVLQIWDQTQEKKATPVAGYVEMKYLRTNTKYIERIEEFEQMKKDIDAGVIPRPEMGAYAEILRVIDLKSATLFQKIPVTVMGMGEVAFVGFGGEPFTEYGAAARRAAPEKFVVSACLVNGGEGYLPSQAAFEEGGYEARNSRFTPDVAPTLQGTAACLLEKLK